METETSQQEYRRQRSALSNLYASQIGLLVVIIGAIIMGIGRFYQEQTLTFNLFLAGFFLINLAYVVALWISIKTKDFQDHVIRVAVVVCVTLVMLVVQLLLAIIGSSLVAWLVSQFYIL